MSKPTPTPTAPSPVRYLIPREHWPNETCVEHAGRGWEVTIVKRHRDWALCRFSFARDGEGRPYMDEWRRFADLLPVESGESALSPPAETTETVPVPVPTPEPVPMPAPQPTTKASMEPLTPNTDHASRVQAQPLNLSPTPLQPFDQPVPNEHTMPPPGSNDAIREPSRPERARRPPVRLEYSASALAAAYVEASGVGFDLESPRMPSAAFFVDTTRAADTFVALAFELGESRGEPLLVADELVIRQELEGATEEYQRAALLAADYSRVAELAHVAAGAPRA